VGWGLIEWVVAAGGRVSALERSCSSQCTSSKAHLQPTTQSSSAHPSCPVRCAPRAQAPRGCWSQAALHGARNLVGGGGGGGSSGGGLSGGGSSGGGLSGGEMSGGGLSGARHEMHKWSSVLETSQHAPPLSFQPNNPSPSPKPTTLDSSPHPTPHSPQAT